MRTPVGRDNAAYRRGLVMGLTMAELFLLLVFCLLIALAVMMASGRESLMKAEAEVRRLAERAEAAEAALAKLEAVAGTEAARTGAPRAALGADWRRLVLDAGGVERLRDAGLDVATLVEKKAYFQAVAPLAAGHTGGEVAAAVAFADAVADELGTPVDPAKVAERVLGAEAAAAAALDRAAAAEARLAAAREGRPVDLPPILTLREDRGYTFETGSAVLGEVFARRLHDETVPDLAGLIAAYDVDVVEVVGHTDERPVNFNRVSNLDAALLDAVRGGPVAALRPADNAGLGLSRAVAVAQVLKADRRLAGIEVLPLSAAQLVDTDDRLTAGDFIGDVRERRRIEIRLRRSIVSGKADRAESGTPPAVE